jgi:succinate-semialdehyde dehydrogenase/glutarate-semialdehyde dehydrogenase
MTSTLKTYNPATGKALKSYDIMSDAEMSKAIDNCHSAYQSWRLMSLEYRAEKIRAVGAALRKSKDELAELMTREMGKKVSQSRQEVDLCIAICDYTADNGPGELADETREMADGAMGEIAYSPMGVIYGIQPWNFPAYQVIRYAIANLMAGNAVLLKHAENVTGSGLLIEQIMKSAGLPEHLFKVLRISHDQSDRVIQHDFVRGVTLTGSSDAGRAIGEKAGKALKKTVLELGSNDAYLVLEDADLEVAVKTCVQGRIYNNGETCVAAKRFIVVDAVYDDFVCAFNKAMSGLKTGDPMSDDFDLGPIARKDLRETLHKQVEDSVKAGARILSGGEMPKGDGYFYPATVLVDVKPGQPAYDDELFGPVASVIRAKDDADAMRIANDSRFGLGGGIFSKDVERAKRLAKDHFDTGMIFINGFGLATPNMPFGGVKNSGFGREHGGFGMKEFVNIKSVSVMAA